MRRAARCSISPRTTRRSMSTPGHLEADGETHRRPRPAVGSQAHAHQFRRSDPPAEPAPRGRQPGEQHASLGAGAALRQTIGTISRPRSAWRGIRRGRHERDPRQLPGGLRPHQHVRRSRLPSSRASRASRSNVTNTAFGQAGGRLRQGFRACSRPSRRNRCCSRPQCRRIRCGCSILTSGRRLHMDGRSPINGSCSSRP